MPNTKKPKAIKPHPPGVHFIKSIDPRKGPTSACGLRRHFTVIDSREAIDCPKCLRAYDSAHAAKALASGPPIEPARRPAPVALSLAEQRLLRLPDKFRCRAHTGRARDYVAIADCWRCEIRANLWAKYEAHPLYWRDPEMPFNLQLLVPKN